MLVDRCRIDRALEFVDRLMTEEHAVSGVLSTAKSSIERSAFVGVLGCWRSGWLSISPATPSAFQHPPRD